MIAEARRMLPQLKLRTILNTGAGRSVFPLLGMAHDYGKTGKLAYRVTMPLLHYYLVQGWD